MNDIYIALCIDRHADETVRVFTTPEKAIQYCRDFIPERYEIEEQEVTQAMENSGWIFYAIYSLEGDSVRVVKSTLDPEGDD